MTLEVFGAGPNGNKLAALAKKAAERLGIHYDMCKISNPTELASRGVIYTPALAINGQTKVVGKLPTEEELAAIMSAVLQSSVN